jgi:RAB protein geranylgeranyltransferase component A
MSGALDPHYDFALLGTSLPLSILSAALARAGFSILHIDEEEHYGGPWSSLTLSELVDWSRNTALHSSQGRRDVLIEFPAFQHQSNNVEEEGGMKIPEKLIGLNRHFAISLAPTIVPCAGPTIDVLIRSKVASYCTFRLLQKTAVFASGDIATQRTTSLRKVPSSKEDIFKDKNLSLVDKRKLMKLLQKAGPGAENNEESQAMKSEVVSEQPFFEYLCAKEGANLSFDLATSIAYGVALCSSEQGEWHEGSRYYHRITG